MAHFTTTISVLLFFGTLIPRAGWAQNNTPKYYKCYNRTGGEWNFGRGPNGCDVQPFQKPSFINREFPTVIFNDNVNRNRERERYMLEMFALIRDVGKFYIKRRKPGVSSAELKAWERAVFATAHQESFWSHYRKTSSPELKMMRGDFGHGHGMMQVDDRWHYSAVTQGTGAHLIKNIVYSLDQYYAAWQRAPSRSCVNSPTNWKARSRSAYSAYNGGPAKICRWTNPNDRWARNDKNWLQKYNNQSWQPYITNAGHQGEIDVECHLNGGSNCFSRPEIPDGELGGRLLVHSKGYQCALNDESFHCLDSRDDAACLIEYYEIDSRPYEMNTEEENKHPIVMHKVNEFCSKAITGLVPAGEVIKLNKNINIRRTPGGQQIGLAPKGTVSDIFDFFVQVGQDQERYYKISHQGKVGYIFAGSSSDYSEWAFQIAEPNRIPQVGDQIRIANSGGINLRKEIRGSILSLVPKGTELVIEDRSIQDSDQKVYFKVSYQGNTGYIYGGALEPFTMDRWIEKIGESSEETIQLASHLKFAFPRTCPAKECPLNGETLVQKDSLSGQSQVYRVLDRKQGWLKVQKDLASPAGWLHSDRAHEISL